MVILTKHPWDWYYLSKNPGINWSIIKNNPTIDWDYYCISRHPNITIKTIKSNPDFAWDWYGISQNPNITWNYIKDNLDKPWSWYGISKNKNITWESLNALTNLSDNELNWEYLSLNFDLYKIDSKVIRIYFAAKYILKHKIWST
jgi:hypothetical protein